MSRPKPPRAITLAEIEARFELASYWWLDRWCPAVGLKDDGYQIRFLKSLTVHNGEERVTYDYFELDGDGVITVAPFGHARMWKPGRVVDIAEAVERFATPDPEARRWVS